MNFSSREFTYICIIVLLTLSTLSDKVSKHVSSSHPQVDTTGETSSLSVEISSSLSQADRDGDRNSNPVAIFSMLSDLNLFQRRDGCQREYPGYSFLTLPEKHSGSHRTIIDIGLKDGQETVAAVRSGYIVYSFEPIPKHCSETRTSLALHKLDYFDVKLLPNGAMIDEKLPLPKKGRGICYLFCVAAGADHEWKTIYEDHEGSSFHDLAAQKKGIPMNIQVVPISDYVHVDVYFMKIDAQGHEVDIMRGARNMYKNNVVRMVGLEFWPKGLNMAGHSPKELVDMLTLDLALVCFDMDFSSPLHAEDFTEYVEHVKARDKLRASSTKKKNRFGWFVELICLNTNKIYKLSSALQNVVH